MELEILTKNNYQAWDDFCLASREAWFWHTTDWLNYQLDYRPEAKAKALSFFVKENNRIAAACPLVLENNNGHREFSYGGGFGPTPFCAGDLAKSHKEKILKFIFAEIDDLAEKNQVKRLSMKFSVLDRSSLEDKNYNYLMKYGFLDATINTQILNLEKPLEELRREVRHGHDAAIARAEKNLAGEIFDAASISEEIFSLYAGLHHKAAGRVTRPASTFKIMLDLIKSGQAFLVGAKKGDLFIGFSYFFAYKNNVYYGSSCNDPDFPDLPIAHYIQWRAIEYMRGKNYQFYEIGWQNFSRTLSDFPSGKEIDIARFKRGFGGITVPLFRGEKYYDKDYFLDVYRGRMEKYADDREIFKA